MRANKRMATAHNLAKLSKVVANDSKAEIVVPCQQDPRYYHRVWVRRSLNRLADRIDVWATCTETSPLGDQPCMGAAVTACVHVLAAVETLAAESGWRVRFCSNEENARRLARIGGQRPLQISGHTKKNPIWAALVR